MASKNLNPKVISSSDAKIEGQLQVEDSLVLDPKVNGSGSSVVITANAGGIEVAGDAVVTLTEDGKIDASQLPGIGLVSVTTVADEEEQLELEAEEGDVAIRSDEGPTAYMRNAGTSGTISDWTQISFISVSSVAGKVGEVELDLADITDWNAADYATASHTHAVADITDFDPADKAEAVHTHAVADITDFDPADKADAVHTHAVADITDFDPADKAEASHTHAVADITDFDPADKADATILDRQTLTQTITVAENAEAAVTLPLATAFGIWKITTNKAARIRLYSTSADRTSDESRAEGSAPAAGLGLITEVITTAGLLSVPLTPPQFGASLSGTPSANIHALIKNKGTGADVEITLIWTPLV